MLFSFAPEDAYYIEVRKTFWRFRMKRFCLSVAAIALTIGTAGLIAQADTANRYPSAQYTAPIAPKPGETAFNFKLKGYVFGIKMISARYKGAFSDDRYSVYSDIKTSGLGALLKKMRIWATTEGRYDRTGVYPVDHTQQNLDKKSRRVEMDYDYNVNQIAVSVVPPNGSQGVPPATPEERFAADDVISAILKMMLTGHGVDGEVCDDNVKVFDSKQHYNLRMERQSGLKYKYEGQKYDAVKCHVFYEPISGFDPEDLPDSEEAGTPVTVYFINRPDFGIWMPAKFSYKISGFKATIKVKEAELKKG